MRSKLLSLSLCFMSFSAYAEAPCNYESNTTSQYQGIIESIKLEKRHVYPYVDDTRKCNIILQVKLKDKWYPSKGSYVFGPDMAEMKACTLAEDRAKVKVIRAHLPEKLVSQKNLKCDLTNIKPRCKVVWLNTSIGKVKMETCEK
jgi:hypothetical protein